MQTEKFGIMRLVNNRKSSSRENYRVIEDQHFRDPGRRDGPRDGPATRIGGRRFRFL